MGVAPFPSRTSSHRAISAAASRPARFAAGLLAAGLLSGGMPAGPSAQSLRGSSASLDRQVAQARRHDFTHLANAAQLRRFVDAGYLVRVGGNADYTLFDVSFPFARPEVLLFVERLSAQYRRACGERLVVTSLTRPRSHQPRNASARSVHPTGMAIDLRRPAGRCRAWLESVLLALEAREVLEATAERRPPHYHVAVYPKPYAAYVRQLTARAAGGAAAPAAAAPAAAGNAGPAGRGHVRGARGPPRRHAERHRAPARRERGGAAPRERPRFLPDPSGSDAAGSRCATAGVAGRRGYGGGPARGARGAPRRHAERHRAPARRERGGAAPRERPRFFPDPSGSDAAGSRCATAGVAGRRGYGGGRGPWCTWCAAATR